MSDIGPLLFFEFIIDISLEEYLIDIHLFADDSVASGKTKTKMT